MFCFVDGQSKLPGGVKVEEGCGAPAPLSSCWAVLPGPMPIWPPPDWQRDLPNSSDPVGAAGPGPDPTMGQLHEAAVAAGACSRAAGARACHVRGGARVGAR